MNWKEAVFLFMGAAVILLLVAFGLRPENTGAALAQGSPIPTATYTPAPVPLPMPSGYDPYLLAAALDLAEEVWFSLNNAGISRRDLEQGRWAVQYLNRVDFLPRDMIT